MAGPHNGHWHAHNGGLPFRPPTVDEAIPYSPFTSIVPFSPDLIPFPSAEPPALPSTLSAEQQSAAAKTIGALDDEIRGASSTSDRLQQTLHELQELLSPLTLSEYKFKPVTRLTTPSRKSPVDANNNGPVPSKPTLSPFAGMLLKNTDVSWLSPGGEVEKLHSQSRSSTGRTAPQSAPRTSDSLKAAALSKVAHARNNNLHLPNTPSSVPPATNTPARTPGIAVVVKALPPGVRPDEFRRFEGPDVNMAIQKKKERLEDGASIMKSREREIADQKMNELQTLLDEVAESKDSGEGGFLTALDTSDGEVTVLHASTLSQLSDAVSKVVNLGCFQSVPTEHVLLLQSLCEPLVAATSQVNLFLETADGDELVARLTMAHNGLRACRLVLQSMTEGRDDRRLCSEDRIQAVVRLLKRVLSACVIPVVESRRTGLGSELFSMASAHRSTILPVMRLCGTVFGQLATLIGKIKLSGFTLSPVESAAIDIIFAQNSEKENDSALGIQKFESLRQKAMDVLAQMFACHHDQRESITNDILTNLERLPDKRGSARQFKSAREQPIMLVTVLFMRIVHAAASNNGDRQSTSSGDIADSEESETSESDSDSQNRNSKPLKQRSSGGSHLAAKLERGATLTANNIARILVARAQNVSKSGDKPFRNILDLFIEDLCNVLGSPEWPAASMFLIQLASIMFSLAQNTKGGGVQAADMALSSIGSMVCGLIDFTTRLKHMKRTLDASQSDIASKLVPLAEDALKRTIDPKDVVAINGPYRVVLAALPSYLNPQGAFGKEDDPHLRSLSGFYATAWANAVHKVFDAGEADSQQHSTMELVKHVNNVVLDPRWFAKEYSSHDTTDAEVRIASGIIATQEPICKSLQKLVACLLNNTKSSSSKLKDRALKTIIQMVDKDPQILDDKTFPGLAALIKDDSPLVKDTAVSLIAKCLEHNPSLERHCLGPILKLMQDAAINPKKKAIKLLKDIYMASSEREKKVLIATEMLLPILDDEKAISDLTCQTLEGIWIVPLRATPRSDGNQSKLNRQTQVLVLILIAQRIRSREDREARESYLQAFERFFSTILSPASPNMAENLKVCEKIVEEMVEAVIDTSSTAAEVTQAQVLQTLSIFAKVHPKLFTAGQVNNLKLYVKNLASEQDLTVFQPTVVIFRYVFPALPTLQESTLEEVRGSLVTPMGKVAQQAANGYIAYKQILLDMAHCLWNISPLVPLGMDKLIRVVSSVATKFEPTTAISTLDQKLEMRILSYMIILGTFGKVCDFDKYAETFRATLMKAADNDIRSKKASAEQLKRIRQWKDPSVAVLFLDLLLPFTQQSRSMNLREQALCSIGEVCQQKTKHFTRADITTAFKLPFINEDTRLTRVVLTQFRDFFANAERRSERGADISVGKGAAHGAQRLENSFAASDSDNATAHIANENVFLPYIINTALGKTTDLALPATEILVSISRQGLTHPGKCGTALVALSTSLDPKVSSPAASEHRKIHLQHETMFEKEYPAAVSLAFKYQRDVFNDPRGAFEQGYKPKMQLLFGTLKEGSRKTLKKFLANLLGQLDFELTKLDTAGAIPDPVLFARFCLENCAFFEYAKVDEVATVLGTIEEIVLKRTGPSVALAIETEVTDQLFTHEAADPSIDGQLVPPPRQETPPSLPENRLRQLTAASIILHMMWETRVFLRRAYNLTGKIKLTDFAKPASRMNFVTGKDLWERSTSLVDALGSPERMKKQCLEFAEIINIDKEHAVGDEDDARDLLAKAAAGYETPDEGDGEEDEAPVPTSGRGRKRKSSAAAGNTPKKHKSRPAKGKRQSKTPDDSE